MIGSELEHWQLRKILTVPKGQDRCKPVVSHSRRFQKRDPPAESGAGAPEKAGGGRLNASLARMRAGLLAFACLGLVFVDRSNSFRFKNKYFAEL